MKRSKYKSDVTLKHYDTVILNEMICAFLEIIDDLILILDEDDYNLKMSSNYELKVSNATRPRTSKVESLALNFYDTKDKIRNLILKYPNAFNILTEEERILFNAIYIDHLREYQVIEKYPQFYYNKIQAVKKTAIIRFSLKLGLHNFIDAYTSL